MNALMLLACLATIPFGLQNGDFGQITNGQAVNWQPYSHYTASLSGGRDGMPYIELSCSGKGDSSGATQTLTFSQPRRGPFVVSAWVRCEQMEAGGDCGIWLDTNLSDGSTMYASTVTPRKDLTDWQKISVEVWPTAPVSKIQLYLLLRNVKGKMRVCDVHIDDIPLKALDLRVAPAGYGYYDVRGALNDKVPWTLKATANGSGIWSTSGESKFVLARFKSSGSQPVVVTLTAQRNGDTVTRRAMIQTSTRMGDTDLWTADSLVRVFRDDLPPVCPGSKVTLNAARNDRESFQICLRPHEQSLSNVRVSVSDLVMTSGSGQIAASQVEWFRVGYLMVSNPTLLPYAERDSAVWWPDALLPAGAFPVDPRTTQPLWFTVHVPKDAAPGAYEGIVTISGDGMSPRQVKMSLQVYPITIPDQGHIKTAFALMDNYLNQIYGSISPQLRRSYTDYLLAHHINPDNISRTVPPDLDETQYADSHGLNAFNIFQAAPQGNDNTGWTFRAPVETYTPDFIQQFVSRLDTIMPLLQTRGLASKAYVYGFDECGPEYHDAIKNTFGAVKAHYPNLRTVSTCAYQAGFDPMTLNIDCWVPLSSIYDPILAKNVRARGGEMWWYVCSSSVFPYANFWFENPLTDQRVVWWQAFQEGVEGLLYWGLNIWKHGNSSPIAADAGSRLSWLPNLADDGTVRYNGDGLLLYPGPNGPIGSIRLEAIRDGLEDFELLSQYKARFGASATDALLQPVTTNVGIFARDPWPLQSARLTMLKSLANSSAGTTAPPLNTH